MTRRKLLTLFGLSPVAIPASLIAPPVAAVSAPGMTIDAMVAAELANLRQKIGDVERFTIAHRPRREAFR